MNEIKANWWERPWVAVLAVLLCAVPLLWPDVPPLLDLPGHMGRYRVELDLARSAHLQRFYGFEWALVGNLGVDLLVVPLSRLFGLELAVKLIVLSIPPMTVAGLLWTAREIHGRVPPTALFAAPLAYNYPFMFGFVNFALSAALAFLAFALWLRLGRARRPVLRAALFVPISLLVWVAHMVGWGMLGLLAFAAEHVRQRGEGRSFREATWRAALACLPLAPPVLPVLLWNQGEGGDTGNWFGIGKINYLPSPLRDRWYLFDVGSLLVILAVVVVAIRGRVLRFARELAAAAVLLLIVYLVMPGRLNGATYTDMRLLPYLLAIAVIGVTIREGAPPQLARRLAVAGLLFLAVRTAGTTASFVLYDRSFDRELAALDHVPRGARMISFVGTPCRGEWKMARLDHLPGMAIVRREAFSNDQWSLAGAHLLKVKHLGGSEYARDPSQIIRRTHCPGKRWPYLADVLGGFPRAGYDYLWLINPPAYDARLVQGLEPVWTNGSSTLFRIHHGAGPAS